ncbi:MAG: threonine/serine dehydratase [candidate division Zixibacteria bacterium]|nr:threonine/serine dehydratase [candidate division Zixibacteria bacterium]
MDLLAEILRADRRIRPHILKTPLLPSFPLAGDSGARVWLKMESEQYTGSFKARGAMNRVLALTQEERTRGIVTASTGNHALGVARALAMTGITGTLFLPQTASPTKIETLRRYPVALELLDTDALGTELYARQAAHERGCVWISPYNDPYVIGGQGTIGVELAERADRIDEVFVTVGGGGLISGIATYLKIVSPETRIVGCLPERSPDMYRSVQVGHIVTLEQQDTLSDGSAGGVEPGAITFPVCQRLVDEYVLVTEEEIRQAVRLMVTEHRKIVEGAAAVAVAAFLRQRERFAGRNVVIVVCGANISMDNLIQILG